MTFDPKEIVMPQGPFAPDFVVLLDEDLPIFMAIVVLQAIRIILPQLKTTIRSSLPQNWFAARLDGDFAFVEQADIGLMMDDAFSVRRDDSFAAYASLHTNWSERIDGAANALAALRPTVLLSNVAYLSLAAAKQVGIPSIAFGQLNWADIFQFYFVHFPDAAHIHEQIVEAYLAADAFLRTTPAMPMPNLSNSRSVGPIARIGRNRKSELRRMLGLRDDTTAVRTCRNAGRNVKSATLETACEIVRSNLD